MSKKSIHPNKPNISNLTNGELKYSKLAKSNTQSTKSKEPSNAKSKDRFESGHPSEDHRSSRSTAPYDT
jgi:hypothetical protein